MGDRRLGGALGALLLAVAGVHLYLYAADGYRFIPTIGWLFLLTGGVAVALALSLAARPHPAVAAAAALFCAGVLGGYVLSLTLPSGIFHFEEPGVSVAGAVAIVAEAGVALVAAGWCHRARRARAAITPGWRGRRGRDRG